MNDYHECARCGAELGDEYTVHEYPVTKPVKRGEMNPVVIYGVMAVANVVALVSEPENVDWDAKFDVDVATCPDCSRPPIPPRSDVGSHIFHALFTGMWGLIGLHSFTMPEMAAVESAFITVVFGALLAGEGYQIGRHKVTSDRDLMYDAWDADEDEDTDPVEEAREAYLRGEIDEDELETRLDEELAEEEREPERVMER